MFDGLSFLIVIFVTNSWEWYYLDDLAQRKMWKRIPRCLQGRKSTSMIFFRTLAIGSEFMKEMISSIWSAWPHFEVF